MFSRVLQILVALIGRSATETYFDFAASFGRDCLLAIPGNTRGCDLGFFSSLGDTWRTSPIRVAFVGDRIADTSAGVPDLKGLLAGWGVGLDDGYAVEDFCGFTVAPHMQTLQDRRRYVDLPQFAAALASQPDVVIMALGAGLHHNMAELKRDYAFLIDSFLALDPRPDVLLMTQTPCYNGRLLPGSNQTIINHALPDMVRALAHLKGVALLVDVFSRFGQVVSIECPRQHKSCGWFRSSRDCQPSEKGYAVIGSWVAEAIRSRHVPAKPPRDPCRSRRLNKEDLLCLKLARVMNVTLKRLGICKRLDVLGGGMRSVIYAGRGFSNTVQGSFAFRCEVPHVHEDECISNNNLIASNLPETRTLLRAEKVGRIVFKSGPCLSGSVTRLLSGAEAWRYDGFKKPRLSHNQILQLAADWAVGLHALHTKIIGYAVLHCDIQKTNMMVIEDDSGTPIHGTLIDYGDGFAQKLRDGQRVEHIIFNTRTGFCHKTNWTRFGSKPFDGGMYSGASDWRDMGIFLYGLVEGHLDLLASDLPTERHPIFRGAQASCNHRCAAARNLKRTQQYSGPLLDLIRFLVLDHDRIYNETGQILNHQAFASLPLKPVDAAQKIMPVASSSEFKRRFLHR